MAAIIAALIFATGAATGYAVSYSIFGDSSPTVSTDGNTNYVNALGWVTGTVISYEKNDDGGIIINNTQSCVACGDVAVVSNLRGGDSYGVTLDGTTYNAIPSYADGNQIVLLIDMNDVLTINVG